MSPFKREDGFAAFNCHDVKRGRGIVRRVFPIVALSFVASVAAFCGGCGESEADRLEAAVAARRAAWDVRAVKLRTAFEQGMQNLEKRGATYGLTALGESQREKARWAFVVKSYRTLSDEFVKVRGPEGVELQKRLAYELAAKLETAAKDKAAVKDKTRLYEETIEVLLTTGLDTSL